jgi:hypothetical protein
MTEIFEEPLFREVSIPAKNTGNIIKAKDAEVTGLTKISVDDNTDEGVKVLLKKDGNDFVKEIKFICSCGHTKTIVLDYSE